VLKGGTTMIQSKLFQIGLLATCGLAIGVADEASADTVDFTDNGNFQTPSLTEGNVTVSGSNSIQVTNGTGLGVAGGIADVIIDPGETITFSFANPVSNVVINDFQTFDTSGDGILYIQPFFEVFDEDGFLVGSAELHLSPSLPINVSGWVCIPCEVLSSFSITMTDLFGQTDSVQIGSISFQEVDDAPVLSCAGFTAPFDKSLNLKKRSKRSIPVRMVLRNSDGVEITDLDVVSPPVVNISFDSSISGAGSTDDELLDPSVVSSSGNAFSYNYDNLSWEYRLGTRNLSSAGTYTVSVTSGDDTEYSVDAAGGACVQTFTRQP